jgi:hypothetical protein
LDEIYIRRIDRLEGDITALADLLTTPQMPKRRPILPPRGVARFVHRRAARSMGAM